MLTKTNIDDCRLINVPEIKDRRGSLGVIENSSIIPFEIERVYFLHNVSSGAIRGKHAHKQLSQLVCAISGSFTIKIHDGINCKKIKLTDPHKAIYICPMIWRELSDFSSDGVCVVFASHKYDPDDYIHDFMQFKSLKEI